MPDLAPLPAAAVIGVVGACPEAALAAYRAAWLPVGPPDLAAVLAARGAPCRAPPGGGGGGGGGGGCAAAQKKSHMRPQSPSLRNAMTAVSQLWGSRQRFASAHLKHCLQHPAPDRPLASTGTAVLRVHAWRSI